MEEEFGPDAGLCLNLMDVLGILMENLGTRLRMHLIKCFTTVDIQVKFGKVEGFWVKEDDLIKETSLVKRCTNCKVT